MIEILRNKEDGLSGIPSGFTNLDRVTSGWQKSDLIIFAEKLIILWVGNTYQESVNVIIVLIISTIFGRYYQTKSGRYNIDNLLLKVFAFSSLSIPIVFSINIGPKFVNI